MKKYWIKLLDRNKNKKADLESKKSIFPRRTHRT